MQTKIDIKVKSHKINNNYILSDDIPRVVRVFFFWHLQKEGMRGGRGDEREARYYKNSFRSLVGNPVFKFDSKLSANNNNYNKIMSIH